MRGPDELDELLGAYALDALDADERAEVDAYLATSPRARAEVREHIEVATFLAFGGGDAPEGVWDRISGVIEGEAPAPGPELARVLPIDREPARRRDTRRWAGWAVGAVAAALVLVLGVVAVDRGRQLDDVRSQSLAEGFDRAMADPGSTKVELTSPDGAVTASAVITSAGTGLLSAGDLPTLAEDRTYQLWGVLDGQAISLGLLGARPDVAAFTVTGDVTALAITEEAQGGVQASASAPALVGEVR